MSKIICTTDWHLSEKSMDEVEQIIDEIYFKQYFTISEAIIIGDLLDRKRPTPLEIEKLTSILCKMLKTMKVTIITGNHEELAKSISALDYATHFGVELYRNKAIIDCNSTKVFFGHHFVDETPDKYCKSNITVKSLEDQSDLVLLGHYHCFSKMGNYTYHLGSIRRCNFKEIDFGIPKYAIIDENGKIEFKDVKSAIPMYEVDSVEKVADIPSKSKIRVVFNSFKQFKSEANKIPELEKKFFEFKIKLDFKNIVEDIESTKQKARSFDEIFDEFLHAEINDKEVQDIIKECL